MLAVPATSSRTLPERLQELLGYNIYPPFLGYVDGRHPRRVLRAVRGLVDLGWPGGYRDGDEKQVEAGGLSFTYLTAGPEDGPLALCLHGFPEPRTPGGTCCRSWPPPASAVAPFSGATRPRASRRTAGYQTGAVARDDDRAARGARRRRAARSSIGHDWGAQGRLRRRRLAPERWRKAWRGAAGRPRADAARSSPTTRSSGPSTSSSS